MRRLQRLTATVIAGAGVLGLAFSGLAAKAFPGRSSHARTSAVVHVAPKSVTRKPAQSAPPLVSVGSQEQPAAPSAPAPAPAPTPAPPVVVSGGS